MTSDCVNLVNEDDAGGILFALLEKVANARRADAHEHLNKIRTGDREERNVGLSGNRPGKQGLTSARRTDQQYPFRNPSAELLELLSFAQEFDNFTELFFCFIHAGDVFERHLLLLH